ncbi:MAG: hypothetical protein JXR76_06590 [Deltaproteobacteria bacterium]|nr:hypothetical protein [Deltaproteobacteria bacterium]
MTVKNFDELKQVAPRCMSPFVAVPAVPVPTEDAGDDGDLGDLGGDACLTGFELTCTCGHTSHVVQGYYLKHADTGELLFYGPISLKCTGCGKLSLLFDIAKHGYDAECGHEVYEQRGAGTPQPFECEGCGKTAFAVLCELEYPDDLFDPEIADLKGRAPELFTMVTVVGKCDACGEEAHIYASECA